MNTENLLGIFIDESRESIQLFSDKLLELEKKPDDVDVLNEIFRVAHTFKGMAKTMGFNGLSDLTHNLENLLELLRSGQKKVNKRIINVLFQGLDKIEVLVETVVNTGTETDLPAVKDLLKELESIISEGNSEVKQPEKEQPGIEFTGYENLVLKESAEKGLKTLEIVVIIENECVLPGVRAYMVNSLLEKEGEIFKTIPSVEEIENNKFLQIDDKKHAIKFYLIADPENTDIKEKILAISEIEKAEITELEYQYSPEEEQSEQESGEKPEEQKTQQTKNNKVSSQTIRVNSERLDSLVNLVGELVISKTMLTQISKENANCGLTSLAASVENITGEIQEIVMKLRMVPIEQVFSRFPRLVRDISTQMDKEVSFDVQGQEIEIDRAIVDEIADPLIHIIRNSLDHGLETREERIKAGKKVKGTLQLTAINEYDNILIKVTDDGRGVDPERVLKKALEKGLIDKAKADTMSNAEIIELLFRPGFSTADKATDLSGRGVGMDVVKTKIAELNGTVSLKSEKGKGTTVTISLPSTMAIIQAMLVRIGEESYALPLNYINEVIDVPVSNIKHIQNREIINFREHVIPVKRLDEILKAPKNSQNGNGTLTLILMQSEESLVGVSVSKIIGQQEIVIKNLNKRLNIKDYISGVTTMGNGQIVPILNVNTLIK